MNNNMIEIYKDWADYKTEVTDRLLLPQWYEHIMGAGSPNEYHIYALDGFLLFQTYIKLGTADATDFENNYKSIWNIPLDHRNDKGLIKFTDSPRPDGTVQYFYGKSDIDSQILTFDFTTESSITKTMEYDSKVYIKGANIITKDAPIGSYIDTKVIHPTNGIIQYFTKNLNLLGSTTIPLNSLDAQSFPQGIKLEITIYNASPAVAFQVVGNLEIYRTNTT